jgi:hypothetical protein
MLTRDETICENSFRSQSHNTEYFLMIEQVGSDQLKTLEIGIVDVEH